MTLTTDPPQPQPSKLSTEGSASSVRRHNLAVLLEQTGMLLVLAILFIACSVSVPNFLSAINISNLLLATATVGIVSCTMLFCLASGNFDLSVGSVLAFAGVATALVMNATGSVVLGVSQGWRRADQWGCERVHRRHLQDQCTDHHLVHHADGEGACFHYCRVGRTVKVLIQKESFYALGNGVLRFPEAWRLRFLFRSSCASGVS